MIALAHEGTMGSASLNSLAFHGHRRTRSAAPWSGSRCMEPPTRATPACRGSRWLGVGSTGCAALLLCRLALRVADLRPGGFLVFGHEDEVKIGRPEKAGARLPGPFRC